MAASSSSNSLDQLIGARILQNVSRRAGLQCFQNIFLVGIHRQNNDPWAGRPFRQLTGDLQTIQTGHAQIEHQHIGTEPLGQSDSLKGAINDMRMKQAMAEIHEMSAGMITNIGGSGDTLNRLESMVTEERDKAAGRARVARDSVDLSQVEVKEAEMTALADQALADFAAREGISLGGADAVPVAPGPWAPQTRRRPLRNPKATHQGTGAGQGHTGRARPARHL